MDPYKVLGVSPDDSEEAIKKAYRALVKKYHPDRYVNTPMSDMANEKLKEINEAYDQLTNKKTDPGNRGYSRQYGGYSRAHYSAGYSVSFETVRMLIRIRRFNEAEAMLSQLPQNAEWFYLTGLVYMNRGWYSKGREFIQKAVSLDPQNTEYAQTLNSFQSQNRNYREYKMEYSECCNPTGILPCLCCSVICPRFCCC